MTYKKLIAVLLLCCAQVHGQSLIKDGLLQSPLDAGGNSITNVASVIGTNGVSILSGFQPVSSNLSVLSTLDGGTLTNLQIQGISTNGSSAGKVIGYTGSNIDWVVGGSALVATYGIGVSNASGTNFIYYTNPNVSLISNNGVLTIQNASTHPMYIGANSNFTVSSTGDVFINPKDNTSNVYIGSESNFATVFGSVIIRQRDNTASMYIGHSSNIVVSTSGDIFIKPRDNTSQMFIGSQSNLMLDTSGNLFLKQRDSTRSVYVGSSSNVMIDNNGGYLQGNWKFSQNGSVITNIKSTTASLSTGNLLSNTGTNIQVSLSGVTSGQSVIITEINSVSAPGMVIQGVSSNDYVVINFYNSTTGTIQSSGSFRITTIGFGL